MPIESFYYVYDLYKKYYETAPELKKSMDIQELIDALKQNVDGFDDTRAEQLKDDLARIDNTNSQIKGFVAEHEEKLSANFEDANMYPMEAGEKFSFFVQSAYSKLKGKKDLESGKNADVEALSKNAETISNFWTFGSNDWNLSENDQLYALPSIKTALKNASPSDPSYGTLSKWADVLSVNQYYHAAAAAIQRTSEFSLNLGSAEEGADMPQPEEMVDLNDLREEADNALRERLSLMSDKLSTIGKFGADSDEFKDFSNALQAAAMGGDLKMLKSAAEDYARKKSPLSQSGKDRLAMAHEVISFLELAIPAREKIAEALNDSAEMEMVKAFPKSVANEMQANPQSVSKEIVMNPQSKSSEIQMNPQPVAEELKANSQHISEEMVINPQPIDSNIQMNPQPVSETVDEYVQKIRSDALEARKLFPRYYRRREYDRTMDKVQEMLDSGHTEEVIKASSAILIEKLLDPNDVDRFLADPGESEKFYKETSERIREEFFEGRSLDMAGYYMGLNDISAKELRLTLGMAEPEREVVQEEQKPMVYDASEFYEPDPDEVEEVVNPSALTESQRAIFEILDSRNITRDQFIKVASDQVAKGVVEKVLGKQPYGKENIEKRLSEKIQSSMDNNRKLYTMQGLYDYFTPEGWNSMPPGERLDKGLEKVVGDFLPKEDPVGDMLTNAKKNEAPMRQMLWQMDSKQEYDLSKLYPKETVEKMAQEWLPDLCLSKVMTEEEKNYFRVDPEAAKEFMDIRRKQIALAFPVKDNKVDADTLKHILESGDEELRTEVDSYDVVHEMQKRAAEAEAVLNDLRKPELWKEENGTWKLIDEDMELQAKSACSDILTYRLIPAEKVNTYRTDPDAGLKFARGSEELLNIKYFDGKGLTRDNLDKLMSMDADDIRGAINPNNLLANEAYEANALLHSSALRKPDMEKTRSDKQGILDLEENLARDKEQVINACIDRMACEIMPHEAYFTMQDDPASGLNFYKESKNQIRARFFADADAVDLKYVEKMVKMSPKEIFNEIDLPEDIVPGHTLKAPEDRNEKRLNTLLSPDTTQKQFVDNIASRVAVKYIIYADGPDSEYLSSHLNRLTYSMKDALMQVPYDKLRGAFEEANVRDLSSAEKIDFALNEITSFHTGEVNIVNKVSSQADIGRIAIREAAKGGQNVWDAETADRMSDLCTAIMIDKIIPEDKRILYMIDTKAGKAFYDEAKAKIVSSFFPADKEVDPEYITGLAAMGKDEIQAKINVTGKEIPDSNKFISSNISMGNLRFRAANVIRNYDAPAWEIREAVADYLMYGTYMRRRKDAAPDSLYQVTKNLNSPMDKNLFVKTREELMTSPDFSKLCENPKKLQQQLKNMGPDTRINNLLSAMDALKNGLDPKAKSAAPVSKAPSAPQAPQPQNQANKYAHLEGSARKAVESGKEALKALSAEKDLKDDLKQLGINLGPRSELLFQLTRNYVNDGARMANITKHWISTARNQKTQGLDNSEMVEKIRAGLRFMEYKGVEFLGRNAEKSAKMIKDECTCGPEEFISNWRNVSIVSTCYKTVFGGAEKTGLNPQCEAHVKSILGMQDTLKTRIDYLCPPVKPDQIKQKESLPGLR